MTMAPSQGTAGVRAELNAWYDTLRPLNVDLVGDFAGKELFAIHGEALLLHCLSESHVDLKGMLVLVLVLVLLSLRLPLPLFLPAW